MKTRREVLKAGAATLAVGVPIAVVAADEAPMTGFTAIVGPPLIGPPLIPVAEPVPGEMHEFTFHFLVTGDRDTARKVMDHFQRFIETSEGWPAKQTGINTSKITRV